MATNISPIVSNVSAPPGDDISAQSPAVVDMQAAWAVVDPLLQGTAEMRKQGGTMLPQMPMEDGEQYDKRLNTSTLFPAYARTVQTLTGKVFSKPIAVGDNVPDKIKAWMPDIDLQGRNLDAFASGIMEKALGYGLAGIYVDCPPRPVGVVSQADEASIGLRPYFVEVNGPQVLGWRAKYTPKMGWTLLQLRIMEMVEVNDGEYGVKMVKQVRLLEPGVWSTYRQVSAQNTKWVVQDTGSTSLDYIPFVPIYGQRLGFMVSKPPLLELAYMNVKHWQSQSDQDNIVHMARVPILVATGIDDPTFALAIGASTCVKIKDVNGKLEYVEHKGTAIAAGKIALDDLKEEMRQAGAELIVIGKRLEVTATQVATENELGTCALQRISQGVEDGIDTALQMMADYAKLGNGGNVTLFNDFGVASLSDASAQLLLAMNVAGKISDETLFMEMQRRAILSADLDWETESELIEAQGPQMGLTGLAPAFAAVPEPPAPPLGPPNAPGAPNPTSPGANAPAPSEPPKPKA